MEVSYITAVISKPYTLTCLDKPRTTPLYPRKSGGFSFHYIWEHTTFEGYFPKSEYYQDKELPQTSENWNGPTRITLNPITGMFSHLCKDFTSLVQNRCILSQTICPRYVLFRLLRTSALVRPQVSL